MAAKSGTWDRRNMRRSKVRNNLTFILMLASVIITMTALSTLV